MYIILDNGYYSSADISKLKSPKTVYGELKLSEIL